MAEAPLAMPAVAPRLRRRAPFVDPTHHSIDHKRGFLKLKRQAVPVDEPPTPPPEPGSEGNEPAGGEESESGEGESSSEEGAAGESSMSSADEPETIQDPQQQRLAAASPFNDPSLRAVPNLGPLPMPPMPFLNTRRSMDPRKIKRRSRRSLRPRQEAEDDSESLSGGISSESEGEENTVSSPGNVGPSPPTPPALPPPPPARPPPSNNALPPPPPPQQRPPPGPSPPERSFDPPTLTPPPPATFLPPPPAITLSSSPPPDETTSEITLPPPPPTSTEEATTSLRITSQRRVIRPPVITDTETDSSSTAVSESSPTTSGDTATITSADTLTATTITSPQTTATFEQSAFIIAAGTNDAGALPPNPTATADAAGLQTGPAPESQVAIIAGTSVLGVALVLAGLFCLFRFCIPVRTWYSTTIRRRRSAKAERMGTHPQPWKWPLQFIFGHDRPAPPRQPYKKFDDDDDLESNSPTASGTMVADGFRPPQATQPATSGTGWVANGWHTLSARVSNWPRRSGTLRWFFGNNGNGGGAGNQPPMPHGDSSRWSDSEASSTNNTNSTATNLRDTEYSEAASVTMYSSEKPHLSQTTQIVTPPPLTPPAKAYSNPLSRPRSSTVPPPSLMDLASLLNAPSPLRDRATPRSSAYTAKPANTPALPVTGAAGDRTSASTFATDATGETFYPTKLDLPPLPDFMLNGNGNGNNGGLGNEVSHFSASTIAPATPRTFVADGYKVGTAARVVNTGEVKRSEVGSMRGKGVKSVGEGSIVPRRRGS